MILSYLNSKLIFSMAKDETVIGFDSVSFGFGHNKTILDEVSFSIRRGSKIALMGQNGAGKSTIFGLVTKKFESESGRININYGVTTATAHQVMPRDQMSLTIREFFRKVS